jgi:ribosomal protein S6
MVTKSHPEEGLTQAIDSSADAGERVVYEVGFHIVPTVPEDGVAAVVEKVRQALGSAEIISEQFPKKIVLAYTVERANVGKRDKYNDAYFGFIKFALEREAIPAFEISLRGMRDVLRFLLIETVREEITQAPRRAVFASDRLEGETIKKPEAEAEKTGPVSDADIDKSIDALVA